MAVSIVGRGNWSAQSTSSHFNKINYKKHVNSSHCYWLSQGAHWVLKLGVQCRWMGYNCCFFLNFVPLHIKSPYNFGGTGSILGVKNPLQRVNGHAAFNHNNLFQRSCCGHDHMVVGFTTTLAICAYHH